MKCLKCLKDLDPASARYGLHPPCFIAWFRVPTPSEFISITPRSTQNSQNHQTLSRNTSFFHGKFKKYSAEMEGQSYILKMRETKAPELPDVEYLCNQIGQALGIAVAEFFMIDFHGERVFVTKNFVKKNTPSDLRHIHHYRSDDQHNCRKLIDVIEKQTKRPYDVDVFLDMLLFDSLIGNHDRHGRNLGFIITSGNISLSPIYDNVSALALETGLILQTDFNPLGAISTTKTREPSIADYAAELKLLGKETQLKNFFLRINLSQLELLIQQSFCSQEMQHAILRLITKRFRELENELKA